MISHDSNQRRSVPPIVGLLLLAGVLLGCGNRDVVFSSDQDLQVMTDQGDNLQAVRSDAHGMSTPSWSPAGDRIGYSDLVEVSGCCNHLDIFVTSRTGSGRSNLTSSCAVSPVGVCNEFNADWHANGIAYELEVISPDLVGPGEIFVMNASGGNKTNLSDHVADDVEPSWSPAGDRIAFASDRNGSYDIYVMEYPGGGNVVRLTTDAGEDRSPAWGTVTVDGEREEWIAFVTDRDGDREIFRILPDGTGEQRVTDNNADDWSPSFMPDAPQAMVFLSDRDGADEVYLYPIGGQVDQLTTTGTEKHTVDFGPQVR